MDRTEEKKIMDIADFKSTRNTRKEMHIVINPMPVSPLMTPEARNDKPIKTIVSCVNIAGLEYIQEKGCFLYLG